MTHQTLQNDHELKLLAQVLGGEISNHCKNCKSLLKQFFQVKKKCYKIFATGERKGDLLFHNKLWAPYNDSNLSYV